MGNIASMARASTALDSYVAELGNDISYDKSLSSSRFLKTILARHAHGPLVLKIFIKPDSAMSLRVIQRRLKSERDALSDLHSVNTYQAFVETEKAGYLIRQWIGSNLYDRVSTQPYLAKVEKRWIAFQILTCLRDARARKIAHGDIKSENILITSDLGVLLTDFSSSFKPTYLPLDDPSDFSFYFDTSSRRTCYIAPERFYASDSRLAEEKKAVAAANDVDAWNKRDGRVTEEMDVFSAGCVIAEMWTDGRVVFNLSELYAYKSGDIGLNGILDNIGDESVREMVRQMLSRDPKDRPSFDRLLSGFRESIFPEYFYTFLADYILSLSEIPEGKDPNFLQRSASTPGNKIDRMLEEWDSISIHLDQKATQAGTAYESVIGPALLLLNLVTSSIRNCLWPSSRLHGLKLFLNLLPYLMDEDKIDRIVPFVVELLADDTAIVRAEACRSLITTVKSVKSITPRNAAFIPEYLLPQMRHLATDPDVFVRATYAQSLVRLANVAVGMLEMSQAAKVDKTELEASGIVEPDYDSMLLEIQSVVEESATTLLVDPSPEVKRAMLSSISDLCLFFGRAKSHETVLSHIMTYLNDRDWQLRLAFFDGIVGVGAFIGIRAIEEYVLPLMLQSLADLEEAVVARVISSLTSLASLGLLPRMRLWDVFFAVKGFLCHPNTWIRQGTAGFIAATARNLPETDVWCILYPSLRTLLKSDVKELDEDSILSALITPLSRTTLVAAKAAAMQNSPSGFWDVGPAEGSSKSRLVRSATASGSTSTGGLLKDKGISSRDERKIVAMKDFILKQAQATRARSSATTTTAPEAELVNGKSVSLTDLGVTPQTVFISPRTVGVDTRSDLKRLRAHLNESSSRRTSFATRSARGGAENPLDEIRRRLASIEPMSKVSDKAPSEPSVVNETNSPSESGISSTIDLAAITRSGRRKSERLDGKAAPAVAASHTNAVGVTTIHDDLPSGRSTPVATGIMTPRATSTVGGPGAHGGGHGGVTPYGSSYDGHDPGVRAFLEQVDLDNYREPLMDLGPKVTASQRKRGPRPKSAAAGVTMIAHLTSHTAPVTSIVTAPDHLFFATASEDGQVHIWDSARLERSVATKPRLTYKVAGAISAMCRIENTHCLAISSEDGTVHIARVYASAGSGSAKYSKIECIRTWRASEAGDGHVQFIEHLNETTLLLVTSTSVIALLDIRTMEVSKRFQHPLHLGIITAIHHAVHWMVVGTDNGTLSLWDLRFGLLLKSWKASGSITSLQAHPARGQSRWIAVSTTSPDRGGEAIVEVYDIETSKLVETYEVRTTRPSTKNAPVHPVEERAVGGKSEYIAALMARAEEPNPVASVSEGEDASKKLRAVTTLLTGMGFASFSTREEDGGSLLGGQSKSALAGTGSGYMLTAGEDRCVRYWDQRPSDGFVICGSPKEKDVSFKSITNPSGPSMFYSIPNRQTDKRDPAMARQPLKPHYDVVCRLGVVETPFSSCVISADRSGIVKVWRLEGGGGVR